MLKKIFICDICGKEIDYSHLADNSYCEGNVYLEPKNNANYKTSMKWHLCEDCFDKIVEYIRDLSHLKTVMIKGCKDD